jgi:hypothetical protein
MMKHVCLIAAALLFASCSPPASEAPPAPETPEAAPRAVEPYPAATPGTPEVDGALLSAPDSAFTAIEPSEVGVQGGPNVREALASLLSTDATEGGELHLSTRVAPDSTIADIVRTGLADDSVAAAHVRIEFRRETEGWYPTNAYRRQLCRRGPNANQWSASPCP